MSEASDSVASLGQFTLDKGLDLALQGLCPSVLVM